MRGYLQFCHPEGRVAESKDPLSKRKGKRILGSRWSLGMTQNPMDFVGGAAQSLPLEGKVAARKG